MINRRLPTEIEIDNEIYPINKKGDYEVILDVIEVLNDKDLTDDEKAYCALNIFYDFNIPHNPQAGIEKMLEFINCGETEEKTTRQKRPVMNWNKDFPMLVAPINRVIGFDIRSVDYLHWWTFVAAYMEIGECTFSTVVGIRQKKQKNQKLEKWEQEYYNENRSKIDLPVEFNREEEEFFRDLLGEKIIT